MAATKLRILETTDLHMQLDCFNYLNDAPGASFGLRGLVPVIAKAREAGIETILCDNGDFLQGSPLADTIAQDPKTDVHPMIKAFNALDYDAITLGNHEFNYGTKWLQDVLADCKPAVVSANLQLTPRQLLVAPWTIITRNMDCDDGITRPLRIGIIGFVTPKVAKWDCADENDAIIAEDIIDAARTSLPGLRRAGADIIIALSHSGISDAPLHDGMENAALHLAALTDIDVVLTGHTHDLFPSPHFRNIHGVNVDKGTLHGKPAVMAGSYGSHLGVIDLDLTTSGETWQVTGHEISLYPAQDGDTLETACHVLDLSEAHEKTRARLKQPLSYCNGPMRSHFAAIGTDPASWLNAQAKMAVVREFQCESTYDNIPLIASSTSFRMGGRRGPHNYLSIESQQLSRRLVAAITPFNSPVLGVLRRGWQLRAWLEHAATYFEQVTPGNADQPLINPKVPSYSFDTLFGLTYRFDLAKPTHGGRVADLSYNNAPVLDDDLFLVATNGYRANGGGGLEPFKQDDIVFQSALGVADALTAYLEIHPEVTPDHTPVWSFLPYPKTSVVFQSAPCAHADRAPLPVTQLSNDADGFSQFRLRL